MSTVKWEALVIVVVFFTLVTLLGFIAARWKRGNLSLIHEWGLAGRRFGPIITWFLIGGDFYTAYVFIAVPGLMWGAGAIGLFTLPYSIFIYPFAFMAMPRLWAVCRRHGYVTTADFVRGRYGSRALALAVAVTGLLATMPYIALQLLGLEVVIGALGIGGEGFVGDIPLIVAFLILAFYTYTSGLRAPAMIAFVKDAMDYIAVLAVVIIIPIKVGGFGAIFHIAATVLPTRTTPGSLILTPGAYIPYVSLAIGSALAAYMYPHNVTAFLASSSGDVIRRNAVFLPIYNIMFTMVLLLGLMCIATGTVSATPNGIVPAMLFNNFPDWFSGFFLAAIAIGALVPAAVMSISAANIFVRNIWKEHVNPRVSQEQETHIAKLASLVVKLGALAFVIFMPTRYAINLQLLGGIWILQTFPAIIFGLYTRYFHPAALFAGWVVGMGWGTWMSAEMGFNSTIYPLHLFGTVIPAYAALSAFVANVIVCSTGSLLCAMAGLRRRTDATAPGDYVEAEG